MTTTPDCLLIVDTTRERDLAHPADLDGTLQAVIAKYLALSLVEVEQVWSAVNLGETRQDYTPGQVYPTSLAVIERELAKLEAALAQQGISMRGLRTVILVDDAAPGYASVAAGLAVQVYRRTHADHHGIGVQETTLDAWRVVDGIPERGETDWSDPQVAVFLWLLGLTGNAFDHLALSVVAKARQVKRIGQQSPITPSFDAACAELERLCIDTQEMLASLLVTTQLLPIHAVVTRLFPQLPAGIDEQALWEVEGIARKAYAQARVLTGASEAAARETALGVCVHWALQRCGGKDLLDLPDDLVPLVECILDQVGHWAFRRKQVSANPLQQSEELRK